MSTGKREETELIVYPLDGVIFDRAYESYQNELLAISLTASGINVDPSMDGLRKEAARRFVLNCVQRVNN